ncbi:hypothetical protein ACFQBQ_05825 [Granulicella cerasi]|uniref:Uncharacterized protein n=1 Tax=Granulicella cerasi TaxID=741063 RepID=A0ABW1Z6M6_9BACT|nr:hypothetical protein [Granulicella cerasi]
MSFSLRCSALLDANFVHRSVMHSEPVASFAAVLLLVTGGAIFCGRKSLQSSPLPLLFPAVTQAQEEAEAGGFS